MLGPLGELLTTSPIQMDWEMSIEPYWNWSFRSFDNSDYKLANSSLLTRTRTKTDRSQLFLTPHSSHRVNGITALLWLELSIWVSLPWQLASQHCSESCTDGTHQNPNTPWTVWELAIAWWFCSGCEGVLWNKVVIPSFVWLVETGVLIQVREIQISCIGQDHQFVIGSICHHIIDTLQCLCHSRHSDNHDWFNGWSTRWIPLGWSYQKVKKAAVRYNWSLQYISLPS